MFLQHHSSATSTPSLSSNNTKQTEDFELLIHNKSIDKIVGQLRFTYLQQNFEASILITNASIQVKSLYPFAGISASATSLSSLSPNGYLQKGALTAAGRQQIVWLMLDIIHLYNLLRFKPGAFMEIYRVSFADAKKLNPELVFGQIPLDTKQAILIAKSLVQTMRLKHKYVFSNPLDLLASFQQIIAHYPQQFLAPKSNLAKLSPVLS